MKLFLLRVWPEFYPDSDGGDGDWIDGMFTTRQRAEAFLACWCRKHWSDERAEDVEPPDTTDAELIAAYFRDAETDRYEIDEREVDPVWVK